VGRWGFICKGHAEYAEKGKDIVCSAVSALTQATLLGLSNYVEPSVKREGGELSVEIKRRNSKTDAILTTLALGLQEVERAYPNHVEMEWTENE
jgi:uncharacterized protein YsxB (DUF464 family)